MRFLAPPPASFAAALAVACAASPLRAAEFDLSALPPYATTASEHGVIRIHDHEQSQHLVHLWQDRFLKLHPKVRYLEYTVPTWFSGLAAGTADIAITGRRAYRADLKALEQIWGYPPLEFFIATGGFNQHTGNTPGVIVFVNRDNPVTGLTLDQLDGIFGAQRTGGFVGTKWTTDVARGADKNLRRWGQVGLAGDWANQEIQLYGIDATLSGWSAVMQLEAFHGGTKWNPAIREFVRGGWEVPADQALVAGVAGDRCGIGFGFMRVVEKNSGVKPLAIAAKPGGPFVPPTLDTFFHRSYPLVTALYLYVNRPPGQPLPPRIREFLSYILSREGQQAVAEDGMFIPFDAEAVRQERRKIE